MGYDSHFMLTFRKADGSVFSEKEAEQIRLEIERCSGYHSEETSLDMDSKRLFMFFSEIHWYDSVDDLDSFMEERRGLELSYTREGEDHDDTECYTWKNGVRYSSGPVEFTPPLPDGKSVCLAWTDRAGCLHVEAVDASASADEQERLLKDGFCPVVVNGADLFGSHVQFVPEDAIHGMSLTGELSHIRDLAESLQKSGYIPFASPSPSSTESRLKRCVANSLSQIEEAIACSRALRY